MLLSAGPLATVLHASTQVGYQYLYPLTWIEVDAPAAAAPAGEGPKHAPRVRRIASPAKDDEVWPNERMLLYLDFQIFPKGHPWDIEKANRKVTPAVTLRLDRRGRIERDLLPDEAAERLLRWRIYRQGRLVGRGSATGVARLTADFGPGTYQVWLGVEGPAGFMPVSNLLEYPLFPDASGENVVIPADTDGDKIPDFLQKMVAAGSGKPGMEIWIMTASRTHRNRRRDCCTEKLPEPRSSGNLSSSGERGPTT